VRLCVHRGSDANILDERCDREALATTGAFIEVTVASKRLDEGGGWPRE